MKRGTRRLLAGFVLIGGAIFLFLSSFSSLYQGKALGLQYPASGSFQISPTNADRYYLWDHYVTQFQGKKIRYSSKFPKDIEIKVTDPSGAEIDFHSDTSHSWSIGNHAKSSIGYIDSPGATDLTVHVSGGDGSRVLSFGKADIKLELWRKLGGFGIALVVGFVGIIAGIWGLATRMAKNN